MFNESSTFFKRHEQLSKFLIVGCLNFIVSFTAFNFSYSYLKIGSHISNYIDFSLLELLNKNNLAKDITFNGAFSNIFGYSCGILNSFVWNKIWTFKAKYETVKQFHNFIILNLACLILSTIFISVFVDIFHAPHNIMWLLIMTVVTFINYYGCKHWVFKHKKLVQV